jgi:hypothetical protein
LSFFILEANLLRHHYSKLVIARICVELKKLARGRAKKAPAGEGDVRDRLARRFNISGRTLDNLEAMLDAPEEVQQVYQEGELSDGAILAVAKLPADLKKKLVAALKNSDGDKEPIIKDFLASNKVKPAGAKAGDNAGDKPATKSTTKGRTKPSVKTSAKSDTTAVTTTGSKADEKTHDDATPESPNDLEGGEQDAAPPAVTSEDPVVGDGHGDETPGKPVAEQEAVEVAEQAAEGVAEGDRAGQAEAAEAGETSEAAEADEPLVVGFQEDDDSVGTYRWALEELPGTFEILVEEIDGIVGQVMASPAAVARLKSIAASIQTLLEAEETLAELTE